MKVARERESRNVIRLLNLIYDRGFVPQSDKIAEREIERIQKLRYQGSLSYMARVFKQLASRLVVPLHDDNTFIDKEFTEETWANMSDQVQTFFSHPVWMADLSKAGQKAKAVEEALAKNQNIDSAFRKVYLTAAFCVGMEKVPSNWAG